MKFSAEPTKGASLDLTSEYDTLTPKPSEETKTKQESGSTVGSFHNQVKDISSMIFAFSDKIDFAALIISLVGYIIISAFGGLKTLDEFLRYIVFLVMAFGFYGIYSTIKNHPIQFPHETKTIFVWVFILVLISLLVITNWQIVMSISNQAIQLLTPKNAKIESKI